MTTLNSLLITVTPGVFQLSLASKVEDSEFSLDLAAGVKELPCMRLATLLVYGMNRVGQIVIGTWVFCDADSNTVKERNQFKKRTRYEVDHYGSTYDYGSIMHYRRTAFGKGKTTIVVRNNAEYIRQGRPTLGQRSHLSR